MSSRKKIRQAPGRLLRQKLVNLLGSRSSGTVPLNSPRLLIRLRVCRKSGNCAFKQPETLDTALDSLHRKYTQTYILSYKRCLYPARHNRPSNQLNTIKYNITRRTTTSFTEGARQEGLRQRTPQFHINLNSTTFLIY
jgi:hypothetical protein